jgi:hypothetical protein
MDFWRNRFWGFELDSMGLGYYKMAEFREYGVEASVFHAACNFLTTQVT